MFEKDLRDLYEGIVDGLGYSRVKRILGNDAAESFVAPCRKFVYRNPEIESDIIYEVGKGHRIDVVGTIFREDFNFLNRFLEGRYQALDVVGDRNFFRVMIESVRNRPELHQYSFEEIIRDLVDYYENNYFS